MIQSIPPVSFEDMKKVLDALPEPDHASVKIFGHVDTSSITDSLYKDWPGIGISLKGGFDGSLEKPTKSNVLDIYKKYLEFDSMSPEKRAETMTTFINVQLMEVSWHRDHEMQKTRDYTKDHCRCKINCHDIEITTHGPVPDVLIMLQKEVVPSTQFTVKLQKMPSMPDYSLDD